MNTDLEDFQTHRTTLLALAYRMLGEVTRAEDIVQDAWIRWQGRRADAENPKAYLIKMVARLCLNELESARARKEEPRSDQLPEPVNLKDIGLEKVEVLEEISMAFLVLLQRPTPAERAVFLLHEVFDFGPRRDRESGRQDRTRLPAAPQAGAGARRHRAPHVAGLGRGTPAAVAGVPEGCRLGRRRTGGEPPRG